MKNMIRYACMTIAAVCMAGCTGDYEKYNTEPYKIKDLPSEASLKAMMEQMMLVQQNDSQYTDQMVGSLGGYFTVSNRWGGQNFDTFNASDDWNAVPYSTAFEGIYVNFFQVEKATERSGHFYALGRLIKAAAMMRMTDLYGPIPYSKITQGEFYVGYDTAQEVYENIIEDLQEAATILYSFSQQYPSTHPMQGYDPIYNGDYSLWARLANSLSMRAAMRSGDREAFEKAYSHPAGHIETNAHNAMKDPEAQPNPYQLASVNWGDLRLNSSIVDYMVGYDDPRCEAYFLRSTFSGYTNQYVGMRSGTAGFNKDEVTAYSMPNIQSSDHLPIFVAAESSFLAAEAAIKGWSVAGTAQSNYEQGIRLSMQQNGIETGVDGYLADDTSTPNSHTDPRGAAYNYSRSTDVKVKWDDGDGDQVNLERIITQKWIANFPMGLEAWAEFRRTGYPELAPAIDNLSGGVITDNFRGMRRLRYPYTERNLNRANYDQAVAALGGTDNESVDLFWTKKN